MIPDCGDKGKKKKWNKLSGNRHEKWQEKRKRLHDDVLRCPN